MWGILMRLGIGAPKVTTKPPRTVTAGETAEVTVDMEGGKADVEADSLFVEVETEYEQETDEGTQYIETAVHREDPMGSFPLEADETRSETVAVTIPRETPVTYGRTDVWIEAGLDVGMSVDPDDETAVQVEPSERMQRVFDAVEDLGFQLGEAYPEAASGGLFSSGTPYVQEFEYRPSGGRFRGELDELELIFAPTEDALTVTVEVDRQGGMLSEMMGTDESTDSLSVRDQDVETIASELSDLIERNI
jgi:sporulation-control protein